MTGLKSCLVATSGIFLISNVHTAEQVHLQGIKILALTLPFYIAEQMRH